MSESGRERATDGAPVDYRATLAGRRRSRGVIGTWRLVVSGSYSGGGKFTCDTGRVSFPAPAGGTPKRAHAAAGKLIKLNLKSPGTRTPPGPGSAPASTGAGTGPGSGGPGGGGPAPNLPEGGAIREGARGRILYHERACAGAPATVKPLGGATVYFERVGGPQGRTAATTAADGTFTMDKQPGVGGPVRIVLALDSDRISVGPAGVLSSAGFSNPPYEMDLGLFTDNGQTFTVADGPRSGAANIFAILRQTAELADVLSPSPPPKIAALGRWEADLVGWVGDQHDSAAVEGLPLIKVGGKLDGSVQDQWQRWALAHEYGHKVLDYLTGRPAGSDGAHSNFDAYPDKPALAYNEGFAWFFAAIAYGPHMTKQPDGNGGCKDHADLSTKPATGWPSNLSGPITLPSAGEEQWAQYQEMNVGAALYQAGLAVGSGNAKAGGAQIADALFEFSRSYRTPESTRDARDAITEFVTAARGEAAAQAVGDAFADQGISYGITVRNDMSQNNWAFIDTGFHTRISGPGGVVCDDEHAGDPDYAALTGADPYFSPGFAWRAFSGPLAGRHDDCFVAAGGVSADDGAFWDLPYFTGNAHHGKEWTVQVALGSGCPIPVTLQCDPFSLTAHVRLGTGRWHRPGEDPFAHTPLNEKTVDVTFTRDDLTSDPAEHALHWKTVATFDADGACTVQTGPNTGDECGVGRKH